MQSSLFLQININNASRLLRILNAPPANKEYPHNSTLGLHPKNFHLSDNLCRKQEKAEVDAEMLCLQLHEVVL
jgi:hypothetical protein